MQYQTPEASRAANVTYHLVPAQVWEAQGNSADYAPEAFDADGFVHCTNGLEALLDVANMFYRDDGRRYVVLAIDMGEIRADVRYDDPDQKFPHIYGSLNTSAVIGPLDAIRDSDGTFVGFEPLP